MRIEKPHEQNCFDVMRHIAALTVMYSHHHAFAQTHESPFQGFIYSGGVAVCVFFAISGYLVTQSFGRSADFVAYMGKRMLRIFPALTVCSFIVVYPLSAYYYGDERVSYVTNWETFHNLLSMIALHPIAIPKIYSGYKFSGPPDGSLWTLPIEFSCYLILGAFLSFSKSWRVPAVLLIAAIAAAVTLSDQAQHAQFYSVQVSWFLSFGMCFAVGALMSATKPSWNRGPVKICLAVVSVWLLIVLKGAPEITVIGFLAIAVIVVVVGTSFRDRLICGRFDVSYGLYIYAWPVQQIVVNEITPKFWPSLVLSIAIVSVIAIFSWVFVEKPFIRRLRIKLYINNTSILHIA